MSFLILNKQNEENCEAQFIEYINNYDLIGDASSYEDYRIEKMYQDVCNTLNKIKNIKEGSFMNDVSHHQI
jgi:uncharacterized protein YutD